MRYTKLYGRRFARPYGYVYAIPYRTYTRDTLMIGRAARALSMIDSFNTLNTAVPATPTLFLRRMHTHKHTHTPYPYTQKRTALLETEAGPTPTPPSVAIVVPWVRMLASSLIIPAPRERSSANKTNTFVPLRHTDKISQFN